MTTRMVSLAVCGISWFGYYAGAWWKTAHLAVGQTAPAGTEERQNGSSYSTPPPVGRSPQTIAPALVAPAESSAGTALSKDNGPRENAAPRQAPVERTEEERRLYASAIFDAEPVDASWAGTTQRELAGKLRGLAGSSSSVQTVDCRNTLCRVELINDNRDVGGDLLRSFMRSNAWPGSGMAIRGEPDPKGRVALTLYLAREGAALPEAEPE
jgi:hypothetical protein